MDKVDNDQLMRLVRRIVRAELEKLLMENTESMGERSQGNNKNHKSEDNKNHKSGDNKNHKSEDNKNHKSEDNKNHKSEDNKH